jgi:ABC-type dipeptide/oligopeptide/nickel transport system ATPase component
MSKLLEIENLRIAFHNRNRRTEVVHGINFNLLKGETVALVGESGSGKSVSALSIARLLPPAPICELSGSIRFEGKDLAAMEMREVRKYRGRAIAYIFQEPSSSLHPQYTVGEQLREVIKLHQPEVKDRRKAIIEAFEEVGIRDPDKRYRDYPFQMSGGMQQRIMIAMALACRSKLLIADEPTTALDVTIQAQILELIKQIQKRYKMTVMLITHNFGIVDGFADRLLVMYQGDIVESGETRSVLRQPEHPYTQGLINCIPRLGAKRQRLVTSGTFRH